MWERFNVMGQQSMSSGKHAEAEGHFRMALVEAEKLGPNDPKVATTLNNLANCLRTQGKHGEAEPLYKRALEVKEKSAGPLHPDLVPILDNYAKLLRASGREQDAQKMEQKARAIFMKK